MILSPASINRQGFSLRPYQERAIGQVREAFRTARGVFLVLPTGAGKTVLFSYIVKRYAEAGKPVVVIAHRGVLLDQASAKLEAEGVPHGIIQGKRNTNPDALVQVCSIDTVIRRQLRHKPALIVVDEAHLSAAPKFKKFMDQYPDARRLLVSATPYRLDGKGFRPFADELVVGSTVQELIDLGYLVRPRYLTGALPEGLDSVKASRGDYVQGELEAVVNVRTLRADVVAMYQKHGDSRSAIAFCVGVKHAIALAEQFQEAGIPAEHLDGSMSAEQRDAILARLASGETRVVCNCNLLIEGFDLPSLGCVILARPTKSESFYIQMVGRVMRPAPGKEEGLILDHGGCYHRFGSIADHREYSLDGVLKKKASAKKPKTVCLQCGKKVDAKGRCEWCFVPTITTVQYTSGELFDPTEHAEVGELLKKYQELMIYAARSKNKEGKAFHRNWAWYQLRDRYKYTTQTLIDVLGREKAPFPVRQELGWR